MKKENKNTWEVWSEYGDSFENLTEEKAFEIQDNLQKKYKLTDEEVLSKIGLRDTETSGYY